MNPNQEKLSQFVEDTVLYHAVKTILFAQFDLNIQAQDKSNTELYEIVRGCIDGQKRLEEGFKELDRFKKKPSNKQPDVNPAV